MNKVFITISIIVTIFIIGIKNIYSQEKEKSFEISIGMQILKIKDNNFSPMTYKGFPFLTSVGFTTETAKYKDVLTLQFQKGSIHSTTGHVINDSEARLTGGSIDWSHVRKLGIFSTSKSSLYLGGVFNSSFTFYKRHYYGEDSYYLYQSSLSPSCHFDHPFIIRNRSFFFNTQFNFALLSYAVYPSYSSSMPDRLLNKDLNDISTMDYIFGGKILTINKFQRINYAASFMYEFKAKIDLKLNYNWELINVNRQNNLTKVNHDIFLTLILK
jgi:hypothetical protein